MTIKMATVEGNESFQSEESRINIFVQQMLMSRVFAASYIGRFYVSSIKAYRDVIQIYKEEKDLIKDLGVVKNRIDDFFKGAMWSAISGPESQDLPSGHCIWARFENIPFGAYWFMIESVTCSDGGEVIFKLKVIRKFETDDKLKTNLEAPINWNEIQEGILKFAKETFTWQNTKESAKFLFLLTMTVVTALLYGLQYLGEYTLRFFREFNNFVKVATPIFLGALDLISKTIGGLYILLAMVWRGRGGAPPPPGRFPSIQGQSPRQFRPIKSDHFYNQRRPHYE